ncbi:hypothetical protein NMY22_g1997 [Coprinellus aureogranulatus]|nr:hypothetical protein NMY22_g1997 [Coprinellus aureogranulatus]
MMFYKLERTEAGPALSQQTTSVGRQAYLHAVSSAELLPCKLRIRNEPLLLQFATNRSAEWAWDSAFVCGCYYSVSASGPEPRSRGSVPLDSLHCLSLLFSSLLLYHTFPPLSFPGLQTRPFLLVSPDSTDLSFASHPYKPRNVSLVFFAYSLQQEGRLTSCSCYAWCNRPSLHHRSPARSTEAAVRRRNEPDRDQGRESLASFEAVATVIGLYKIARNAFDTVAQDSESTEEEREMRQRELLNAEVMIDAVVNDMENLSAVPDSSSASSSRSYKRMFKTRLVAKERKAKVENSAPARWLGLLSRRDLGLWGGSAGAGEEAADEDDGQWDLDPPSDPPQGGPTSTCNRISFYLLHRRASLNAPVTLLTSFAPTLAYCSISLVSLPNRLWQVPLRHGHLRSDGLVLLARNSSFVCLVTIAATDEFATRQSESRRATHIGPLPGQKFALKIQRLTRPKAILCAVHDLFSDARKLLLIYFLICRPSSEVKTFIRLT